MIPKQFYKVKRKSKVYEEIQYLSQGYKKFLSYSTWDKMSRMIYHVDMDGKMTFEKLNLKEERLDILMNPLLGPMLRRTKDLPENADLEKKQNKLMMYYLNRGKKWDIDNYIYS